MVRALLARACAIFRVFLRRFRRLFIQSDGSLAGRRCSVMALTITVRSSLPLTQGKGCNQLDDFAWLTALAAVMHLPPSQSSSGQRGFYKNARPTAIYHPV